MFNLLIDYGGFIF